MKLVQEQYPRLVKESDISDKRCHIQFTRPEGNCVRYGFVLLNTLDWFHSEDYNGKSTSQGFKCTCENDLKKWLIDICRWILVRDLESDNWFS